MQTIDYIILAIYIAVLCVISWIFRRVKKDSQDFFLAGRSLGVIPIGLSVMVTTFSAVNYLAMPGEIASQGLYMLASLPAFFLAAWPVAKYWMPRFLEMRPVSVYAFLEERFDGKVRLLCAVLFLAWRLFWMAVALYASCKIMHLLTGMDLLWLLLLCSIVATAYSSIGGMKAVVWTDVLQFIVLVGGLFCIIGFLIAKIDGGIVTAVTCPFRNGHGLANFSDHSFFTGSPYSRLCFWLLLLGYFLTPVSTMCSDQMTIQRLIASGSVKNAVKTQTVNAMLTIPTEIILWFIGLAVFTFFFQHPELPKQEGDTALFFFISTQLPTPIPGLVLSGMMAAVISTLNAVFNGMATVYLKEFHVRYFRPGLPEERQVRVARIATAVIGLLAIALGLLIIYSAKWLRQSVVEASTIFKALEIIVMPAFLFAILSKRASTTLVWVTAGLMWGVKVGTLTWYTLSTAAVAHWEPGMPMGWGGPVRPYAGIAFVALGIVLAWLWRVCRARRRTAFTLMLCSMISFGYAAGLLLWSLFSNTLIKDVPRSLSFQWGGLPLTILYVTMGLLWCRFGPPQPKEKYQGLTLFDSGEVVK